VTPSAQPVFFVDWCFGKTVVNALREAGALIEHHGDHFEQNAPDTEWLPVVGDRGWVVLTKDKAIAKNQLELMAIARAKVKVFILTLRNLPRQEILRITQKIAAELAELSRWLEEQGREPHETANFLMRWI
jgi:predicted nuclease of predicted toxin-antitoxin system